jgi:hypothetical protein
VKTSVRLAGLGRPVVAESAALEAEAEDALDAAFVAGAAALDAAFAAGAGNALPLLAFDAAFLAMVLRDFLDSGRSLGGPPARSGSLSGHRRDPAGPDRCAPREITGIIGPTQRQYVLFPLLFRVEGRRHPAVRAAE